MPWMGPWLWRAAPKSDLDERRRRDASDHLLELARWLRDNFPARGESGRHAWRSDLWGCSTCRCAQLDVRPNAVRYFGHHRQRSMRLTEGSA